MNNKIKILHAFLPGTIGGVYSYLMNMYRKIDRKKFDIKFLVFNDTQLPNYEEVKDDIIYITPRNKNYFKFLKELKGIYRSERFDYIHCHLWSFACFEHILLANKYTKANIILHSHVADLKIRNPKIVLMDKIGKKLVLKNKRNYIFSGCSEVAIKKIFGKNINDYHVLKNGIDIKRNLYNPETREIIRRKININENTIIIGQVGNFVSVKNHIKTIKVFNQILQKNKNYVLLLIGSGDDTKSRVLSYARENHILDRVIVLENIQNVNEYLSAMDIFLFPSTSEGLGIALIEAETNGLPCIVSNAIPKEAILIPTIKMLPLEASDEKWASEIIDTKINNSRIIDYDLIKEYDIRNSVKELEALYLNNKKSL